MSIQGAIDSAANSVANAVLGVKAINKLDQSKEPSQEPAQEPNQEQVQEEQQTVQTAIEQKPDYMRVLDNVVNRAQNSMLAEMYSYQSSKKRQQNTLEFIRSKRMEGETV